MARFLGYPKVQFFDNSGLPLASGKLYTYVPGTTTNKATYPTMADAVALTNANANPVVLDSRGEAVVVIVGTTKLVLKDSSDAVIWTVDNVTDTASGNLLDSNGNTVLAFSATTNAVNEITIANAATGGNPTVSATGDDANPGIDLQAKGTGTVNLLGTSSTSAELRLFEDTDNGTNYVGIKCPASVSSSTTYTLPAADGSSGNVLATDSSGTLSWVSNSTDKVMQVVYGSTTTYTSSAATIPYDDTIPQNTEGAEILTVSITPTNASNILYLEGMFQIAASGGSSHIAVALFQDSTAGALACSYHYTISTNVLLLIPLVHKMTAGTTSATTFKVRVGASSGSVYVNGGSSGRRGGGAVLCSLKITEVAV